MPARRVETSRVAVIAGAVVVLGLLFAAWKWARAEPAGGGATTLPVTTPAPPRSGPVARTLRELDTALERGPGPPAESDAGEARPSVAPPGATQEPVWPGFDAELSPAAFLTRNAEAAKDTVDRFCEVSERLRRSSLPKDERGSRDAWAYMSVRISWEAGVAAPGLLRLPPPLRERMSGYGHDWPALVRDEDLVGLDFTWMRDLHQFDTWTVMRDVPLRDPAALPATHIAIPNYLDLLWWAKLRFARAFRTGDFVDAASDVRQLAALLRTNDLTVADRIAMALWRIEREAWDAARAAGVDTGAWVPVTEQDLSDFRLVSRAAFRFMLPGVDPEVQRKALACNASSRCALVLEGVSMLAATRAILPPQTPGGVTSIADASGCDPRLIDWLRRTKPLDEAGFAEVFDGSQADELETYFADAGQ